MPDYSTLPDRHKKLTLLGVLLGLLLAALDQTIVATAGPAIQRDLHIEPALYAWLTTSYLVASVVMTPVWGKLSDLFGRRKILVTGIVIFIVGSILCGVSQSTGQLLTARVIQGIGSASLFTTAFSVIADLYVPRERGRYAGLFGGVFGLSSVAGPLVGGFITDTFGWHWCFLINLPVGLVALVVIATWMPALAPDDGTKRPPLDVLGALIFALAVVPFLAAASLAKIELRPGDVGYLWSSPQILVMAAMALVFFVAFLVVERRAASPLIDLKLFRSPPFSIGVAASFIVGMSFLGAIVFLPLFMVNVAGASATSAGLTTTPLTFGIVAGNIVAGQVSSRIGRYKGLLVGSLAILALSFLVMTLTLHIDVTPLGMAARMVLVGIGLGPSIPLFNLHIQMAVPPPQIGAATSLATLSRSLGSTLGIAIFGNLFGLSLAHNVEQNLREATAGAPAAVVAQLAAAAAPQNESPAVGGDGEGVVVGSVPDEAAIVAALHASFEAQRAKLQGGSAEVNAARQALIDAEAVAVDVAHKVTLGFKQAFADAVARIYAIAIIFAVLGLVLAIALKELPLRGGPVGTAGGAGAPPTEP